jgi:GNAT superfamily N-acetyltransferase
MVEPEITEQVGMNLTEYNSIPISFEVRTILDIQVIAQGMGGFVLSERQIKTPWVKDYGPFDRERPRRWVGPWEASHWPVISAFVKGSRVGGCVLAYDLPGLDQLEGRKDVAALWDLRVHPDHRGSGIGSRLFEAAVAAARRLNCHVLKVETQNINVPACRFYVKHGCVLGLINRYAYDQFPDEVELVWYRQL